MHLIPVCVCVYLQGGDAGVKAPARRGTKARDDGDGDVTKLQDKLKGKEEEAKQLKNTVKELEGKVATLIKTADANKTSLDRALEKGEAWNLKLKAAEKAGADAEKKLATASSKIKQLEGKVKELETASASCMAFDAAAELEEKVSGLETLIANGQQQLQAKTEEANMLKKELLALKTQIATLEKEKAKDDIPPEEPAAVGGKRKKGRYSIQDTDELMNKLGGLQAQFLEIQKAGAAVKGRKPDLNSSLGGGKRDLHYVKETYLLCKRDLQGSQARFQLQPWWRPLFPKALYLVTSHSSVYQGTDF